MNNPKSARLFSSRPESAPPSNSSYNNSLNSSRNSCFNGSCPVSSRGDCLPTNRREYISNHPAKILSQIHSEDKFIHPSFTKITQTPWTKPSKLYGGLGTKQKTSNISKDAPEYFFDPNKATPKVYREIYDDFRPLASQTFARSTLRDTAEVLPGGKSILNATNKFNDGTSYRTKSRLISLDNRVLIDFSPVPRKNSLAPIDWNSPSSRRPSTAKDRGYLNNTSNSYMNPTASFTNSISARPQTANLAQSYSKIRL